MRLDKKKFNKPSLFSFILKGLDCEWKPTFGPEETDMSNANTVAAISSNGDKNQRANLFQIATRTRTFLVEVRDLVDILDQAHLDRFGSLILFNDDLIKLGYNFDQDSHRLSHCFRKFQHRFCEFTQSVINMDEMASYLTNRYKLFTDETEKTKVDPADSINTPESVKSSSSSSCISTAEVSKSRTTTTSTTKNSWGSKPKGLSKLTQQCLGKPLDKRECMSNWQNRPLRPAQLRYAALDAFVLIKIFDFFIEKLKSINADVDFITNRRKAFF